MKKAYLLAFSDSLGTREQIKDCINNLSSVDTWRCDMTNAFYIISELSADLIAGQIREHFKNEGRFILTELGINTQGWLTSGSWYLINNKSLKDKD